ncbi:MAG: phytochelatin synthase, partial [Sphingobacteriia bacterium]|nr:phytochelatin synthase [Sphingobacteriia bacterium]
MAAIVLAVAFVCVGGAWAFGMGVWWLLPPPPEAVADGVVREGPLLEQALARAPARLYLVDFELQERLTSCAPASVRNLLVSSDHAVESERALFDAQPVGWMRMLVLGMTLEQVAGLLEHNEAGQVEIARDLDYAAFLAQLERTNDPAWR